MLIGTELCSRILKALLINWVMFMRHVACKNVFFSTKPNQKQMCAILLYFQFQCQMDGGAVGVYSNPVLSFVEVERKSVNDHVTTHHHKMEERHVLGTVSRTEAVTLTHVQ